MVAPSGTAAKSLLRLASLRLGNVFGGKTPPSVKLAEGIVFAVMGGSTSASSVAFLPKTFDYHPDLSATVDRLSQLRQFILVTRIM